MILAFLKGIYLGLGLVMPLGPLNLYIFNNGTLHQKFRSTLPVILVACVCDSALVLSAVGGVNIVSQIVWFKPVIMLLGIGFLFYMGVSIWSAPDRTLVAATAGAQPRSKQILYAATLSLFNPHSIMDTFIVIGAVSAALSGLERHAFTAGCIIIDCAWFAFLGIMGFFLHRISSAKQIFYYIDKFSSLIMLALAVQLTIDFIREFIL